MRSNVMAISSGIVHCSAQGWILVQLSTWLHEEVPQALHNQTAAPKDYDRARRMPDRCQLFSCIEWHQASMLGLRNVHATSKMAAAYQVKWLEDKYLNRLGHFSTILLQDSW